MSSDVCPFCGKTYKRLKSHLPHCKAAASSKKPPTKHDVTDNQTPSPHLDAALTGAPVKEKRFTQMLSKKVSVELEAAAAAQTASSSVSLPSSTKKKKKQKLSEQIRAATTTPSSETVSLVSSQSPTPPLPPVTPKSKKKNLRALIEAAKSKQVPASEGLPSGSTTSVDIPLNLTETETDALPKPTRSSKTKASAVKKAAQSPLSTTDTSSSLDSEVNKWSIKPQERDDHLVEREIDDLSLNKIILKSGNSHQAKITVQDVRATLGRANSSRPSILSQIVTADLNQKPKPGPGLGPAESPPKHRELQPVKRTSSKSKQSLVPVRHDGSSNSELTSAASPLLLAPPQPVSMKVTGLPTRPPSLPQFSSPLFPLTPQTLPTREEALRGGDGLMMEKSPLREQNITADGARGALTQRSLGQVRLRDLPEWLACRTPTHPREVVEMVQRGWQWYYRRYINVKKGGVGGLGMLLAGYCVLSYIWSYPHIKHDRWRKYH